MSRYFSRGLPTIVCEAGKCYTHAVLPVDLKLPTREDNEGPQQREQRRTNTMHVLASLQTQPLPAGWLHIEGGAHYLRKEHNTDTASDPEFCSLNCARLWLMARIKPKKVKE